jgi:intracellular septation protein A
MTRRIKFSIISAVMAGASLGAILNPVALLALNSDLEFVKNSWETILYAVGTFAFVAVINLLNLWVMFTAKKCEGLDGDENT